MATTAKRRIYYFDQGRHLRAVLTERRGNRYVPIAAPVLVSYPIAQAAIAELEDRPDLHPSEVGLTELGAGKLRKKVKGFAKKVAHSQIVKKIAKAGMGIATAVTAVVPGAQGAAVGLTAAQVTMKAAAKAKKARAAAKKVKNAIKPNGSAVATASQKIRAAVAKSVAVPATSAGAALLQSRIVQASKVVATLPPEKQADAISTVENRLNSYKVITPEGNTIWVSRDALEQEA